MAVEERAKAVWPWVWGDKRIDEGITQPMTCSGFLPVRGLMIATTSAAYGSGMGD